MLEPRNQSDYSILQSQVPLFSFLSPHQRQAAHLVQHFLIVVPQRQPQNHLSRSTCRKMRKQLCTHTASPAAQLDHR